MENQHRQIKGYRELNQDEINLMNRIKAFGLELQSLVQAVNEHNQSQFLEAVNRREDTDLPQETRDLAYAVENNIRDSECARWAAMARTDFQTGLMKLTRAVAKPEFF